MLIEIFYKTRIPLVFPGKALLDWIVDFNCVYDYPIVKRNKEYCSPKKGGIRGLLGNSRGIPREFETKSRTGNYQKRMPAMYMTFKTRQVTHICT